jgi:hypothetical protein
VHPAVIAPRLSEARVRVPSRGAAMVFRISENEGCLRRFERETPDTNKAPPGVALRLTLALHQGDAS